MTVVERLKLGRERIARGWTQGRYARNAKGGSVGPDGLDAVCWCASGALCLDGDIGVDARMALRQTIRAYDAVGIVTWNDDPGRTQADVLKAFDDTIARLEAAEAT